MSKNTIGDSVALEKTVTKVYFCHHCGHGPINFLPKNSRCPHCKNKTIREATDLIKQGLADKVYFCHYCGFGPTMSIPKDGRCIHCKHSSWEETILPKLIAKLCQFA